MATAKSLRTVWTASAVLLGLVPVAHAQETLAGVGAASGIAAGMGAVAATNVRPGAVAGRAPSFPGDEGGEPGGAPGPGGATTTTTTTTSSSTTRSVRFNSTSGQVFVNELLRSGDRRPTVERRRRSPAAQAAYARRIARATPSQRSRGVLAKYKVPPVGWRAYYLPQDRYKFGKVWQYVSIEDDSGAYPVKYYYRPNSLSMLRLLSNSPKKGPKRYNRVIGFRNWQEAMLAGYRPDPISKPEPAGDVVYLARLTRSSQLDRYVEYLYAGQVVPVSHQFNVSYVRHVARIVNQRSDTRPMMDQTISQVLGAILGENPLPTTVGTSTRITTVSTTSTSGPMAGGTAMNASAGATDKRDEDFNKFGNRAGSLANVPANNR